MQSSSNLISWFEKVGLQLPEIIRIPDLKYIPSVTIEPNICKFLLYEAYERVGHWVILYYSEPDDCWVFFDPYGYMMDDQLKFSYHKDMELTEQIVESGEKEIEINEFRYQADGTSTCGKICAVRYLFSYLGLNCQEFKEQFYDNMDLESRDIVLSEIYDIMNERNENIVDLSSDCSLD